METALTNLKRLQRPPWNIAAVAAVLSFFMWTVFPVKGQENGFTEYHVKALFLYNFGKYVVWPEQAFADTNTPITIGVIGKDDFGDDLIQAVKGKSICGHLFAIRHLSAGDDVQGCQILFVSKSESPRVGDILAKVGTLPVLTVGEDPAFAANGGMINFVLKDGNVRLEINLMSANKAGLKISSKLLAVADVVKGKGSRP